ncbi:MAG: sensor histidine kinase [Negativicutes bacterium]|nr:sensor histidine kinase [Negativicutes bacterium]
MDDNLSMILLQRISIIAVLAYVFSHTQAFRMMFKEQTTNREKLVLVVFFSAFSIAGTYFGIPIEGALANFRDTGTVVAGLLGGPAVGIATGLISGLHRISLGGFTAIPCGITTILGGIAAGYVHYRMKPREPEFITGATLVVAIVLFSMGLILLFSTPESAARSLVAQITLPMSLANALGVAVFMIIVHNARIHQTKIGALQTHKALKIANAALPYFRKGLSQSSAEQVASTILTMTSAAAVAITDNEKVLAHIGVGSDHHIAGVPLLTNATRQALQSGQMTVAQTAGEIGCDVPNCQLRSAVVVPLFCREQVVGTLKIYYQREEAMSALDLEFAQGLGQIFSTQLELALLQQRAELTAKAELKALRAQINPHFLFNALNTIVSLIRTNPEQARNLLVELSEFFRRSLKVSRDFITLREEMEQVDSYLVLEKARFGDRLRVEKKLDRKVMDVQIPAFTLQPLVENAVKHGLLTKEEGGTVCITAAGNGRYVEITICDDGEGIPSSIVKQIFEHGFGKGAGIGLSNVKDRLKAIYGTNHILEIVSAEGAGTTVTLKIPAPNEV